MGVYIKSMEMPRRCYGCVAHRHSIRGDEYDYCMALDRKYNDNKFDLNPFADKFGDCPLIEVPEPHGDLIDRDELVRTSGVTIQVTGKENAMVVTQALDSIYQDIDDAPTVIEAE